MKNKIITSTDQINITNVGGTLAPTKSTSQATEEQIRYAKLSQINNKEEQRIQEKN